MAALSGLGGFAPFLDLEMFLFIILRDHICDRAFETGACFASLHE